MKIIPTFTDIVTSFLQHGFIALGVICNKLKREENDVICLGSNESEEGVGVTNSPQTEQPKDNEVEIAKKRKTNRNY